jgi:hypothetical protein
MAPKTPRIGLPTKVFEELLNQGTWTRRLPTKFSTLFSKRGMRVYAYNRDNRTGNFVLVEITDNYIEDTELVTVWSIVVNSNSEKDNKMIKMTQEEFETALANGRRDFSNLDLSGLNISGRNIDMTGFNFTGANLEMADFSNPNLRKPSKNRLTPDERECLHRLAKEAGMSTFDFVRTLISDYGETLVQLRRQDSLPIQWEPIFTGRASSHFPDHNSDYQQLSIPFEEQE